MRDEREPRRTLMEAKESRMTLSSARQLLRPSRSFSCTVIDGQSVPDGREGYRYAEEENLPRGPLVEVRMRPTSSMAFGEEKEMVCERASSVFIS